MYRFDRKYVNGLQDEYATISLNLWQNISANLFGKARSFASNTALAYA